jgi:hypothetical protein
LWESTNIKHLFPVGEVNGSHGVYRPGGSALNAGQVGGFRAAEYINAKYTEATLHREAAQSLALQRVSELLAWTRKSAQATTSWQQARETMQQRMSEAGAHIRNAAKLAQAKSAAWTQYHTMMDKACQHEGPKGLAESLRNRQLCFAHAVYLEALAFAVSSGTGSRGSALVTDVSGTPAHPLLGEAWCFAAEDSGFRDKVLQTVTDQAGKVDNQWVQRRPLPQVDNWFETAWADFNAGKIYD